MAIKLAVVIALRSGVLGSYEQSLAGRLKRIIFGFGGNKKIRRDSTYGPFSGRFLNFWPKLHWWERNYLLTGFFN